jgi:hypothetical protein
MSDLSKYLPDAFSGKLLPVPVITYLVLRTREVLRAEPNLLTLSGTFVVVGDIHGFINQPVF